MSNNQPPLSVVMAVYNGERGLKRTLESLEAQTFQDFELVIVDDGSTDKTWQIIQNIDRGWLRAHRNMQNRGQTASLNTGVELAGGEFIARHDAEDISHPERFEQQMAFLKRHHKTALVGTQIDWIDGSGKLIRHFDYPTDSKQIKARLSEKNSFAHGSIMARREALIEVGCYREVFRLAQDYDLWLRVAERFPVANLDETFYKMRFSLRMASVARNDEQNAYAAFARKLASERQEHGEEQTDLEAVAAVLARTYNRNFIAKRIARARNYVTWAERLQWWGEPASRYTWTIWNHALSSWPLSWPVWKFVAREIRDTFTGSAPNSSS